MTARLLPDEMPAREKMTVHVPDRFKAANAFWIGLAKIGLTPAAVLSQSRLPLTVYDGKKNLVTTAQFFALWRARTGATARSVRLRVGSPGIVESGRARCQAARQEHRVAHARGRHLLPCVWARGFLRSDRSPRTTSHVRYHQVVPATADPRCRPTNRLQG